MVFAFNTAGLTFQEVAITMFNLDGANFPALRRFAGWLAVVTSGSLTLLVCTPLLGVWLRVVAGLGPELAHFARLPFTLIVLLPAITAVTCFQRAMLVAVRTTRPITWASGLELAGIGATLFILTVWCGWVGAVAAAVAMVSGRLAAMAFLMPRTARALKGTVPA
jgi:hypothetical protein